MAFFRRLLDAIKVDRGPYQVTLLEFPAVDTVKLKRELKIEERGKARGQADQPPSDHSGLDDIEQEIVARFQQFKQQADECLAANRQVYAGRLARLDNRTLLEDVDREFESNISDFKAGTRTDANRLYLLRQNVIEAEQEYGDFRRDNRLSRMARYPAHWFRNVSIVLLFFLADTIANAVFFSTTHPRGWAGAIFESIFISGVNTVLGFAAGYFLFRGCNHRRALVKFISFVGGVLFLAFILLANVFAAHYRDAFAALTPDKLELADEASKFAFRSLLENKWVLAGFSSYLMVVVGLIVYGVAAIEGFKLDDPHPGFGHVARNRETRVTSYSSTKEMLLTGLKEQKDDALAAIDHLLVEIRRRDEEYATVLASQSSLVNRYNASLAHLESAASQLLEGYRTANRVARKTPVPSVFGKPWSPEWVRETVSKDTDDGARANATGAIAQRLGDARRAFLKQYDDAVIEYLRVDQIVTKEAIDHARAQVS